MAYETIHVEKTKSVALVMLQRPQIRNAFNDIMIQDLHETFLGLKEDSAIRVVVLTGEGKAFCAGADLHWMRRVVDCSYEENLEDSTKLAVLFKEMYNFPKPVLGRINGAAIGGGTGLVAVCDIAVAADTAVFSFSEIKIGLVPACISPYVLKKVGERLSREYFLSGKRLTADEALKCGLVNKVVPLNELDRHIEVYVKQLLSSGPNAVATCKKMLGQIADVDLETAGPLTAKMITDLRMSEEGQEGMRAFLENRKPAWND